MLDDTRQRIVDLRAEAIAISELGGTENLTKASALLGECADLFKEILPKSLHLSPKGIRTTHIWEAREWALLCESMGNIYAQLGMPEALDCYDQARRFMIHKDDIDRLEQNYKNVETVFKRDGII